MDFITRSDSGLESTESLYGKKSDQYALKKILVDAENRLETTGRLVLGKQCATEYIMYHFHTNKIVNRNEVVFITKAYWNKDVTEFKKKKEKEVCKSIQYCVNHDVYDLIMRGYKLVNV